MTSLKVPSDDGYVSKGNKLRFHVGSAIKQETHLLDNYKNYGKGSTLVQGVCENIYGKLIFNNDAWKLKEFMGLKRLDSTTPYVKGSWKLQFKIYNV